MANVLLSPQGGSVPAPEHPLPTAALCLLKADALTSARRVSAEGCRSSWDGYTCTQAKAIQTTPEGSNRAARGALLCGETSNPACPSSTGTGHLWHESADTSLQGREIWESEAIAVYSYPTFSSTKKLYSCPSETSHSPIQTPTEVHGSNLSCVLSAPGQASVSKGQSQLKISKQAMQFCLALPFKYNFSSV